MLRFLACALALQLFLPAVAAAQTYPDKPIRFIVPFPPGASTDLTARIIGETMSALLGQPIVVENKPGAAAAIGIDLVAKSKPDGYTMGISGVGATAIIPLIDPKLPYSPLRDLEMVAGLSLVEGMMVAKSDLKQNTMKEVLDFAKANPEKVSYATAGVTGPAHLNMENLMLLSGAKLLHVPFPGDSPAVTSVLAGDVTIGSVSAAVATPFVQSGKLKPLSAGGPDRLRSHPDLPTIAEQTGYQGYTANSWNVLVVPKGTPAQIIQTLNKAVNDAIKRPEVKDRLEALGLSTMPGDVKWTEAFVAEKIATNKRIIEATGLKRE